MRNSLLVLTILLAACSSSSSDGPHLTFADFENPPSTTEVIGDSSTTTPTPPTTSGSITTTSTTLLVVDTPGPVAIRHTSGYSILEGRGAPQRILDTPVAAGFDDVSGGFLFQLPGAGSATGADQRIFWVQSANPDAQPWLDVTEGSLLKLWGVELIAGSPNMILTITDHADDPEARIERLVVFDVVSRLDRVLGEVGRTGAGPLSISYGGGRFLLEQTAGVQAFFEFRNDQGAVLDLASNPQPGCSDDPDCPNHPALDPSGSLVAFLEAEGQDLVVHDLDLDQELQRITMPAGLGEVSGLEFDGATVIVNRRSAPALIVDVAGSAYGEFGLDGVVYFLRQGPGFDGSATLES